jgi:hypothetical protein
MASSKSLKMRAARPNGGGASTFAKEMRLLPLVAEYLGAAQPRAVPTDEGYPTDPADPFAAAKPIDWSLHPVDSPLHGVAVPGAGPYPEELLEARRALEPDPSASYMGETLAGWRKTIPTYDPIYGAPQQPRSEFAIPRGLAGLGQKTLDMFAGQSVDPGVLLGLGSLGSRPAGSLGTFGTSQAKDLTPRMGRQYENARQLLNKGESPEKVERLTGLAVISLAGNEAAEFKYSQSRNLSDLYAVRHHIPDDEMTFTAQFWGAKFLHGDKAHKLGDIITHPKLFEAYPSLKDVQIRGSDDMGRNPAHWLPGTNMIEINRNVFSRGLDDSMLTSEKRNALDQTVLESIIHEVSHAVQSSPEEGNLNTYSSGTSPNDEYLMRHAGPLRGKNENFEDPDLPNKGYPKNYETAREILDILNSEIDTEWDWIAAGPTDFTAADELTFQRHRFMKDRVSKDKETTFTDESKRLNTQEFNVLQQKRNDWLREAAMRGAKDSSLSDYNAVVDKIRQAVDLEHRILDSERRYLDNLGERQARVSELLVDQPKHPSIQFNKIFERMAEAAKKKGLREGGPYPNIIDLMPEQLEGITTGRVLAPGLLSAQAADAAAPKTASGHKINTAFGLGKMKTPKGKNKGGYVMTGAETMMGLD